MMNTPQEAQKPAQAGLEPPASTPETSKPTDVHQKAPEPLPDNDLIWSRGRSGFQPIPPKALVGIMRVHSRPATPEERRVLMAGYRAALEQIENLRQILTRCVPGAL